MYSSVIRFPATTRTVGYLPSALGAGQVPVDFLVPALERDRAVADGGVIQNPRRGWLFLIVRTGDTGRDQAGEGRRATGEEVTPVHVFMSAVRPEAHGDSSYESCM